MDYQSKCVICFTEFASFKFLPCEHACICTRCLNNYMYADVVLYAVYLSQVFTGRTSIVVEVDQCVRKTRKIVRNKGKIIILHLNGMIMYITFVCWSLKSLCHSNRHIETMPAREINPFTALTRIRSQFLRTQWSTSNHSEWTRLRIRPLSHRGWRLCI